MRGRLAVMMALVFAVQGSWYPLLAVHLEDLGLDGQARGLIFATFALGSVLAPLGMGQLADRLVAVERLLAINYGLGAVLLVFLAAGMVTGTGPLFALFLVYWVIIAPGLGLSSTLALRNLERPRDEFGAVRLWGTVGWMVVGWVVSAVMALRGTSQEGQGTDEAFAIGALMAAALSAFAATKLPHTPPLASGRAQRAAMAEARDLLRRPIVALYLFTAFGVTLTLPYMFQVQPTYLQDAGLPRRWIASAMTLGQMPEIAALWALPWLLRRFGDRGTLGLGISAWVARYGMLAIDPPLWIAVAGIPLHGIGIACFTIAGQMFLDGQAPPHRRAAAQGVNMVVTAGVGALLGNLMAGAIVDRAGDYTTVFAVPFGINLALLALWAGLSRWAMRAGQAESPGRSHPVPLPAASEVTGRSGP